jgi:N-glycosylase/DNA lyase
LVAASAAQKTKVRREHRPVTIDVIRAEHRKRRRLIRTRLGEFRAVWTRASDEELFSELVYCIFTAGASAKMVLRAVEAIRPWLGQSPATDLTERLLGVHRYPRARAGYVVVTRDFLHQDCGMQLHQRLRRFRHADDRRDWLARERGIKGLGYKESSHFLRNIGFSGYGILDKHILRCLAELGVIDSPKPPGTRNRYLEIEGKLRDFAREIKIDFDELDLVLWSFKTGEVLK